MPVTARNFEFPVSRLHNVGFRVVRNFEPLMNADEEQQGRCGDDRTLSVIPFSIVTLCAQTHPLQAVIEAARGNPPALKELLATNFPNLKNQGTALVWGQDFLFVAETAKEPIVSIDAQPARGHGARAGLRLSGIAW
jgi:hypothetical protein